MRKPIIAILANFPYWLYNAKLPRRSGHYAVWLSALHEALEHCNDFEFHWISLSKEAQKRCVFSSHRQTIHVLPGARLTIGLYTSYLYDRFQVAKELRSISPDLVHSWGTEECYGLCGCDFRGRKIHSVQGLLNAYMERGSMGKFERRHSFYEPRVLRSMPYLTTESPWAAERVRDLSPKAKPFLWEYAVEDTFFCMEHRPTQNPTCFYAGSNIPIKNVEMLIRVFSSPKLSHVQLNLAGIEPQAYPQVTPNIHLLGRLSREKVAQLLSETWCLVHPSLADTGPTIVKEARVVGVPVILTKDCGSKQHVIEGKSGYTIEPNDTDALINRVLKVTANRETSVNMGAYGREEVRQALSADTMVSRLLDIYRCIFAGK